MAEIGQSTHDAIVTPAGILLRHSDNQGFQFGSDSRPAEIAAMLRSIKLACNQSSVPAQDGVWLGDTSHPSKSFAPEPFSDLGERGSLWI